MVFASMYVILSKDRVRRAGGEAAMWNSLLLVVAIGQAAPLTEQDPADNAAIVYRRYFDEIEWEQKNSPGKRELLSKPVAELSREELPVISRLLPAVEKPFCDWGLDFSKGVFLPLPHLQSARSMARAMQASARLSASEGQASEAADALINSYRLARDVGSDNLIVCYLYRTIIEKETIDVAGQVLSSLSADERKRLLNEHQKMLGRPSLKPIILRDKDCCLGWIRRQISRDPKGAWRDEFRSLSGDLRVAVSFLDRSEAARNLAELDALSKVCDEIADIVDQPTKEISEKLNELTEGAKKENRWAKVLLPPAGTILLSRDQLQTKAALLAAAADLLEQGEGAIADHADPFGTGSFRLNHDEGEWVLESGLRQADGKPLTLRVWR